MSMDEDLLSEVEQFGGDWSKKSKLTPGYIGLNWMESDKRVMLKSFKHIKILLILINEF